MAEAKPKWLKKASKKIRLYLNQDGLCYYCNKRMSMVVGDLDLTKFYKETKSLPHNLATIEHIFTRFEEQRYDHQRKNGLNVLACFECNQKMGIEKEKIFRK